MCLLEHRAKLCERSDYLQSMVVVPASTAGAALLRPRKHDGIYCIWFDRRGRFSGGG